MLEAPDVSEGRARTIREKPHVIVLDLILMLPGIDGMSDEERRPPPA